MSTSSLSRRRLLSAAGVAALAVPLLQACGQRAAPTATPPPATPTSGSASATPAATKPAAQGAARLSVAVRSDTNGAGGWQRAVIDRFTKENANVTVDTVAVPYDEMAKKQLAMLATDTMPDAVYSGIKWFHYSAFKGAFHALDDFIKAKDPGMDDFFKAAVEGCRQDGKLYGLPIELNTGNQNIVIFNKDVLAEKGVAEPTDDWTLEQFVASAAKITDKSKHLFGTNFLTGSYYDFSALARTFGGDLLSDDGKQFTLTTDPKAVEAARWETELRTKHNAAPARAEALDLAFAAGQIGLWATGIYSVVPQRQIIADKFKWDAVLGPKAPSGLRGYEAFVGMYSMSAKSKAPEAAYDFVAFAASKPMSLLSIAEYGYSSARISAWSSPEVEKLSTIYGRAAEWMADPKQEGPFPMPYNLRFSELQDKWANLSAPLFYGEVGFDEGMKRVQEECQQIVALPRG